MFNPRYLSFLVAGLILIASPNLSHSQDTLTAKDKTPPAVKDSAQPAPASVAENAASAQASAQEETPAAKAERETWRKSMVHTPLPKNGCFKVSFPNKAWQEVRCLPPSPYPNRPKQRGGTNPRSNTVGGNFGDWSAQSAGTISSAEGSFNSVNVTGT